MKEKHKLESKKFDRAEVQNFYVMYHKSECIFVIESINFR